MIHLLKLNSAINWEMFRAELEALRDKQRKSNAGAKPYDAVLMFKILITSIPVQSFG